MLIKFNHHCPVIAISFSLAVLIFFNTPQGASAQVVITMGVQEVYDDNIYLENNRKRPNPFVVNNSIADDLEDNSLSILNSKRSDGKTNDDLISSASLGLTSTFNQWSDYVLVLSNASAGILSFAENEEENRFVVDGLVDLELSKELLPDPFYLGGSFVLNSESESMSIASGTASQASESFNVSGRTGIRDEIFKKTFLNLGYTPAYHRYLGAWMLDSSSSAQFEEDGSDYYSHTGNLNLNRQFTDYLRAGISGYYGAQIFTSTPKDSGSSSKINESDLDRSNAAVSLDALYNASKHLTVDGSVGFGWSALENSPDPFEQTVINQQGESETIVIQPNKDNQSFIFDTSISYLTGPGSIIQGGANQSLSTDTNGSQVISRTFYLSSSTYLTDSLTFLTSGSFIKYAPGDSLSQASDRYQLNASFNYSLNEHTSLLLGYSYIKQNADDSVLDEQLLYTTGDYTSNRFYLALTTGLVGI